VTAVEPSDVADVFVFVGRTEVKFLSAKPKILKCVVYCMFNDPYKTTIMMMNQSTPSLQFNITRPDYGLIFQRFPNLNPNPNPTNSTNPTKPTNPTLLTLK